MIISVIVRTYNEERNLEKFILAYYDWVDYILIQDDESDDIQYLIDLRKKYSPKVKLSAYFGNRIIRGGVTRAYHHIQLNQLIGWAENLSSDWIIMDDCDSIPNRYLKMAGRSVIESTEKDFIYVSKIHFYKDLGHFPEFSNPGGKIGHCLWAWKANKDFEFKDNKHKAQLFDRISIDKIHKLDPPIVTLHYSWPNDEVIEQKRLRYTAIYGAEYARFDPLKFGGKIEEIPEWAVE